MQGKRTSANLGGKLPKNMSKITFVFLFISSSHNSNHFACQVHGRLASRSPGDGIPAVLQRHGHHAERRLCRVAPSLHQRGRQWNLLGEHEEEDPSGPGENNWGRMVFLFTAKANWWSFSCRASHLMSSRPSACSPTIWRISPFPWNWWQEPTALLAWVRA